MKRILLAVSLISFLGLMGMARLSRAQEALFPTDPCGNGVVDPGEECDGSVGCNSDCKWVTYKRSNIELPTAVGKYDLKEAEPQPIFPTDPGPQCGDKNIDSDQGETCDDGNTVDGDGCDHLCHVEVTLPPPAKYDPPSDGSTTAEPPAANNPSDGSANSAVSAPSDAAPGNSQALIEGAAGCSMAPMASVACNEVGFGLFGAFLGLVAFRRKK